MFNMFVAGWCLGLGFFSIIEGRKFSALICIALGISNLLIALK